MSESTLTAAFLDLQADVGYHLGYTRDPTSWNSRQAQNVAAVLKAGLRQFYFCGYQWSFLKPMRSVFVHSGDNVAELPADYCSLEGPVTVSVDGQSSFYRQLLAGSAQDLYLREKRMPKTPGSPEICCEELVPDGPTPQKSQRMRLRVWPSADAEYTLTFPMTIAPQALSGQMPFAYGGAQHAECLLESCKAAAERDIDNKKPDNPDAVHQQTFFSMLEISKQIDRRSKAQTLGPMWDRSDLRRRRVPGQTPRPLLPILVQGQLYD
jgi:hypothetical protein